MSLTPDLKAALTSYFKVERNRTSNSIDVMHDSAHMAEGKYRRLDMLDGLLAAIEAEPEQVPVPDSKEKP